MPSACRAARTRSFRAVRRFSSSGCAVRRSVRKRTLAPDSRGRHGTHSAACRASAAKCGSTHRGGPCFSIIDPSWRPASMRGQPTSNVNKEPGRDLKISSIDDVAIVHGGAGHMLAHAVGCIAWAGSVEPRRIPSGSCVPARPTRPSSSRHCLQHAPPRRCVVAAAGDQAVWRGRLRQRAARILTDGRQGTGVTRRASPCCTAGGGGRHDRHHTWPRRFAGARPAGVSPCAGTAERDARRGVIDYGM